MHYYNFNIGDYKAHTEHLDLMEDLAFRRMLDWCYLHEKPLPTQISEIERLIRMRTHSESIKYVLQSFFTKTSGGYVNNRIQHEVEKYQEKSKKAKESAKARWNKKPNKNNDEFDANALQAESESNAKHKTLNTKHKTIDNLKGKPATKLPSFSKDDLDCAEWFYNLLLNLNPNHKKPKLEKWADDVRKIVKLDNRSYQEISDLMLWVNKDNFWQTNILSPAKLREKWDQLTLAKNKKPTGSNVTANNMATVEHFKRLAEQEADEYEQLGQN